MPLWQHRAILNVLKEVLAYRKQCAFCLQAIVSKDGARVDPAVLQAGGARPTPGVSAMGIHTLLWHVHVCAVCRCPCTRMQRAPAGPGPVQHVERRPLAAAGAAALEEAAGLVNEGDLLVTALSLNFATTALREQPASAATVTQKVVGMRHGSAV